jgi:hypothetical protein
MLINKKIAKKIYKFVVRDLIQENDNKPKTSICNNHHHA